MFFLFPRLEHPAGWICARYKSLLLLVVVVVSTRFIQLLLTVALLSSSVNGIQHACVNASSAAANANTDDSANTRSSCKQQIRRDVINLKPREINWHSKLGFLNTFILSK